MKKPPPLVPSCLMATCEAAGPTAMFWVVHGGAVASVVACTKAACWVSWKVCTTPCDSRTTAKTIDSGSRM